MSKVLYITANPKPIENSYSLSTGEIFIEEYSKNNPDHEIKRIDLFENPPPLIDREILNAFQKLKEGVSIRNLDLEEQKKLNSLFSNTEEFIDHDKYIFAYPMWNFNIPPYLKAYIDNIVIAGKTFKYTPEGSVGILQNKKALLIQASGGFYTGTELDHGVKYIKGILNFIGVFDLETILIQGVEQFPDKAPEFKQNAIIKAEILAKTF